MAVSGNWWYWIDVQKQLMARLRVHSVDSKEYQWGISQDPRASGSKAGSCSQKCLTDYCWGTTSINHSRKGHGSRSGFGISTDSSKGIYTSEWAERQVTTTMWTLYFCQSSKIYLIHQTAREFLMRQLGVSTCIKWSFQPNEVELLMAQICVRYLVMDDLVCSKEDTIQILLEYAVQNWADHFRNTSSDEDKLMEAVL